MIAAVGVFSADDSAQIWQNADSEEAKVAYMNMRRISKLPAVHGWRAAKVLSQRPWRRRLGLPGLVFRVNGNERGQR